jgi:hypothetical protein
MTVADGLLQCVTLLVEKAKWEPAHALSAEQICCDAKPAAVTYATALPYGVVCGESALKKTT